MVFLIALMATGCTKAVIEQLPDKSEVNVLLEWDATEQPMGMKFYFYPAEGESVGLIQAETSSEGYRGELGAGRYRVLAYNTDATGVQLSGMESYETAMVEAAMMPTRADGIALIAQPSVLYSGTAVAVLEVRLFEPLHRNIVPKQLTRTLTLKFATEKLAGVNSVEGELRGLFSSVMLATGEATTSAREQARQVGTRFSTPVVPANTTVKVSYFGILSPEEGAYKNEMPLTLKGDNGWEQTTTVDMTKVLTDIVSQEQGGEYEFEMEDNIEIEVKPTPVGISASVVSWTRMGEGEGEFSYITYY